MSRGLLHGLNVSFMGGRLSAARPLVALRLCRKLQSWESAKIRDPIPDFLRVYSQRRASEPNASSRPAEGGFRSN